MHIGSQITDLDPFRNAFALLKELVGELRADGFAIDFVNLGGGLGVPYRSDAPAPPLPAEYGKLVKHAVGDLGCKLLFEPGRMIAANAGILVSRVLYVKHGAAEDLHHRRRGDERSDPPDALRGLSRDLARGGTGARQRRPSSPTWWVRSARPAIIWRWRGRCRSFTPAISLP